MDVEFKIYIKPINLSSNEINEKIVQLSVELEYGDLLPDFFVLGDATPIRPSQEASLVLTVRRRLLIKQRVVVHLHFRNLQVQNRGSKQSCCLCV